MDESLTRYGAVETITEGKLTDIELPEVFFGCGTVFQKEDANEML